MNRRAFLKSIAVAAASIALPILPVGAPAAMSIDQLTRHVWSEELPKEALRSCYIINMIGKPNLVVWKD